MTDRRRNDGLVGVGALGALLGLGPDGVRAAERRGQLPAAEETPGGHRRWDLRVVAAFLEGKGRAVPARLAAAIGGGASPPAPAPPPGPNGIPPGVKPAPASDPFDTSEDDGADAFLEEVRHAAAAAIEIEVGRPPERLPVSDLVVQALPRWAGIAPHELRLGHVRGVARAARELAASLERIVVSPARGASPPGPP